MKLLSILALLTLSIGSARAADMDCRTLAIKSVSAVSKLNSGAAMKFDSVKLLNSKDGEGKTRIRTWEIFMKDENTDAYEGYYAITEEFSGGGCLMKQMKLFQYD